MIAFCGCYSECTKENSRTYVETQGNLQITYTYNDSLDTVISKNIYNTDTGLTIEYFYFYEEKGWGEQFVGLSVITTDKEGRIISKYEDNK